MRAEFIARGYVECSLCTRLVSPAFIREVRGIGAVALCPDRQGTPRRPARTHAAPGADARLRPGEVGQPGRAGGRR